MLPRAQAQGQVAVFRLGMGVQRIVTGRQNPFGHFGFLGRRLPDSSLVQTLSIGAKDSDRWGLDSARTVQQETGSQTENSLHEKRVLCAL